MKKRLDLYLADMVEPKDKLLMLSLVSKPASGMRAKKIGDNLFFVPILPANTLIYRKDSHIGEYNIIFMPDSIQAIMAKGGKVPFDIEHSGMPIDGVTLVESFQIDYSKGKVYNDYPALPDGTWVGIISVKNTRFSVSGSGGGGSQFLENFGISVSGIFTYDKVSLSDAIKMYNELKIR